jgi:hypothetical protein
MRKTSALGPTCTNERRLCLLNFTTVSCCVFLQMFMFYYYNIDNYYLNLFSGDVECFCHQSFVIETFLRILYLLYSRKHVLCVFCYKLFIFY